MVRISLIFNRNYFHDPGFETIMFIFKGMAMVRNSVGSEAYLADEIITARSGKRVRVGNTDAEGRMAMVDLLCHVKERCINENLTNPEIYTIATLTGHGQSISILFSLTMKSI